VVVVTVTLINSADLGSFRTEDLTADHPFVAEIIKTGIRIF
jgi:hypothetical protein